MLPSYDFVLEDDAGDRGRPAAAAHHPHAGPHAGVDVLPARGLARAVQRRHAVPRRARQHQLRGRRLPHRSSARSRTGCSRRCPPTPSSCPATATTPPSAPSAPTSRSGSTGAGRSALDTFEAIFARRSCGRLTEPAPDGRRAAPHPGGGRRRAGPWRAAAVAVHRAAGEAKEAFGRCWPTPTSPGPRPAHAGQDQEGAHQARAGAARGRGRRRPHAQRQDPVRGAGGRRRRGRGEHAAGGQGAGLRLHVAHRDPAYDPR